jgi:(E)-4-hydroxy-3-methylbut-2-enyl-diphosphate synthase
MGMVVSAIEFLKIFTGEGFDRIVVSMKSSDTLTMVTANRLLVKMMAEEGMFFPIHLGITEAGEGEDGRIISAAGTGTLLAEGIGDTVRVSLSEPPEDEIPVARAIIIAVAGEAGRVTSPVAPLERRRAGDPWLPQVYDAVTSARFTDESGVLFAGEAMTVAADQLMAVTGREAYDRLLNPVFHCDDPELLAIESAALLGRFFIARHPAGLCITNSGAVQGEALRRMAFAILQATEARITRTRYISCPTCGRTKFNLQEAVQRVKAATAHLTGMKIAVMGCVVNGPGEMAGADYGYVGAAEGKVHIYRGTEAVYKNIPEAEALEKMLELIESDQASR